MSPETAAFEQALAFHCAPTLAALTCANLISLSQTDYPGLKDLLRDYCIIRSRSTICTEF